MCVDLRITSSELAAYMYMNLHLRACLLGGTQPITVTPSETNTAKSQTTGSQKLNYCGSPKFGQSLSSTLCIHVQQ